MSKDARKIWGYRKLKYTIPTLLETEAVKQTIILTFPNDVRSFVVLPSGPHIAYQVPILQGKQNKV
jgi:hypothetical protein